MSFVERQILEAQRKGFFDDLPGRGKPIADIGTERPEGWWAEGYVRRERAAERLRLLVAEIARAKAASWRLDDHDLMHLELLEFNRRLAEANEEADPRDHAELIEIQAEMKRWRQARRRRLWGL